MSRDPIDHHAWYENIAAKTGGYVKTWDSTVVGESGEDAFVELLFDSLDRVGHVLDAGCGSGQFTIEVASRVRYVTGFDFSERMIDAANLNAQRRQCANVTFVHATAGGLPFTTSSFDLVFSRRGPTSILLRPDLLVDGGVMLGVHSERMGVVKERLEASGLVETRVEEYDALEVFPSLWDFAAFWSRMPGHPDYLEEENGEALAALAREFHDGKRLVVPHWRCVWRGKKGRHGRGPTA
jgi:SAM-dependent methyltransferase